MIFQAPASFPKKGRLSPCFIKIICRFYQCEKNGLIHPLDSCCFTILRVPFPPRPLWGAPLPPPRGAQQLHALAGESVCLRFNSDTHFPRTILFPLLQSQGPDMQRAHAWQLQAYALARESVCLRFDSDTHFPRIVLFPLFQFQGPDMQRAHAWRFQTCALTERNVCLRFGSTNTFTDFLFRHFYTIYPCLFTQVLPS